VAGQVIFFAKEHRKAATGGIRCDPNAIDPTTDDGDVVDLSERGRRQGRSGHRLASGSFDFLYWNSNINVHLRKW
jgi:hypothetical protein